MTPAELLSVSGSFEDGHTPREFISSDKFHSPKGPPHQKILKIILRLLMSGKVLLTFMRTEEARPLLVGDEEVN